MYSGKIRINAKINLFLNVVNKRPDGFHTIETVFQNIGLFDTLFFEKSDSGIEVTCDSNVVPAGEKNLVWQAAYSLQHNFPRHVTGVKIHLEKKIPPGAGLGGASADAAATLFSLNSLFDLNLSQKSLSELGNTIGKDVPFFFSGDCALATGTGERLERINRKRDFWVVLVYPGFEISTTHAYEMFDQMSVCRGTTSDPLIRALEKDSCKDIVKCLYNCFEEILEPEYPLLTQIRDTLLEVGCDGVLLSGSGSCTFGILQRKEEAVEVTQRLESKYPWVALASTASNPYELTELS